MSSVYKVSQTTPDSPSPSEKAHTNNFSHSTGSHKRKPRGSRGVVAPAGVRISFQKPFSAHTTPCSCALLDGNVAEQGVISGLQTYFEYFPGSGGKKKITLNSRWTICFPQGCKFYCPRSFHTQCWWLLHQAGSDIIVLSGRSNSKAGLTCIINQDLVHIQHVPYHWAIPFPPEQCPFNREIAQGQNKVWEGESGR